MSTFSLWSAFVSSICWAITTFFALGAYANVGGMLYLALAIVGAVIFLGQAAMFVRGIKDVNNADTCVPTEYANRALYPGGGDDYRTFR